ncbi:MULTISPECIES: CoA transferase subunit A [unclassified Corynebacterium]|uniref:CoA transferase subunit A n=1 Tax=Corynebacterium TaxID=1716 RepID=UPI00254BC211|nr:MULTISPECIES: CoA transferase subunit A [unclassified Corynebacterium]MDK8452313.1 CoA transferase subunit A [Corynebacterium sp. MSK084]MDK8466818.1 CoA transferase subunit A [Corynebacterium sp. MSK130]MDK8476075.1 CoA transferase subunit A [Corynebacterium sp. MSK310]MDK8490952.1 CoA transferase subunit A [Corynebacterium sp. MSK175]MDK8514372.1 CoA transferase subunit A [Corynebacterium sp. MSK123]
MLNKVIASVEEAVADIPDGSSIAVGGFGLVGIPAQLIAALRSQGASELTIISNNLGTDDFGLGLLLKDHRIARSIGSYLGTNKEYARQYLEGELTVEFTPQGTLAERMRAGGAGIPAFYTKAGVGTPLADGDIPTRYNPDGTIAETSAPKETREFNGELYVMEEALTPDFAFVHAARADRFGNLAFNKTAQNFNPDAAKSADITIVQAEQLVEAVPSAEVDVPGIYVDRVVEVGKQETGIEFRTVSK